MFKQDVSAHTQLSSFISSLEIEDKELPSMDDICVLYFKDFYIIMYKTNSMISSKFSKIMLLSAVFGKI